MHKSTHAPRPSPSGPSPHALTHVRDELQYHGRLLALAACMGGSLSQADLVTLSVYLLRAADRLAGKEGRP